MYSISYCPCCECHEQVSSNPDEEHWIAMKNILKYLRRTKDLFLIFGGDSEWRVEGYTDSDFISDPDDRKSISEYVFVCNGGAAS